MSLLSPLIARQALPLPVDLADATSEATEDAERRRHPRFEVDIAGRFMRGNKHEYPCRLTSISVGGASFMAPVEVDDGERIIAYLDQIGGIEGKVIRGFDGGFAIKLIATQHKREKLAAQITWLINRSELEGIEARRPGHDRVSSASNSTLMRLPDDQEVEVTLQDVSISGASVAVAVRPPLGTEVCLGKLRALVVRHHADGVGVQFLDIQNPDALRRYFG